MTARHALKRARELIVTGDRRLQQLGSKRDLIRAVELSAADPAECIEALDLLEAQAAPAAVALWRAGARFLSTQLEADGLRALELARVPGSDSSLAAWIDAPGRKLGQVLELFNRAINKQRNA